VRNDFPQKKFSPDSGHFVEARCGLSPANIT
jgi:hypothetical protein